MPDAADAWLSAIEKRREKREQIFQQGKIADQIVKTEPKVLEQMGLGQDEWNLLAPQEKALRVTGVIEAQGYRKAVADLKRVGTQTESMELENTHAKDRMGRLGQFGRSMESFENTPEMIRRPRREVMEPELMRLFPEDAARYSGALENLGRDFTPGQPRQIPGTHYWLQQVGPQSWSPVPGVEAKSQRPEKMRAPSGQGSAWIFTDDVDEFRERLGEIEDPEMVDAILERRRAFNLSTGKSSEGGLAELLGRFGAGGSSPDGPKGKEGKGTSGGTAARKWDPKTKRFIDAK